MDPTQRSSTPPPASPSGPEEPAILSPLPSTEDAAATSSARPVSRSELSPNPDRYVRRIAHARSSRKRAVPSVSPIDGEGPPRPPEDGEETLEDFLVFASGGAPTTYEPLAAAPTYCGPALFFEDTTTEEPPDRPAVGGCLSFADDVPRPEPTRKRVAPTVDFDYDAVARKNASDAPAAFADPSRVVYESLGADRPATPPTELLRAPPSAAAPPPPKDATALSLWLASRGLGTFADPIKSLGLRKISDLALLSDDDLDEMGMPVDLRVNIRISIG
jgi:hypothetical protein